MKGLFIGIIVLLAVILTFSMFIYHLTSEISEGLFYNLEELMKKVEEEQWSETALCLERLNKKWNRADAWWTPLMDHSELDLLDQTIIRIDGLVRQHRKEDALLEIKVAERLIERVFKRESLSIKNIF